MEQSELKERFLSVQREVAPYGATLLLATKTQSVSDINFLIEQGATDIGENRVQEFLAKENDLLKTARFHLIGSLQSNKAKGIVGKADLIHSVDGVSLLQEIDKRAKAQNIVQRVLIEINSGREANKGGLIPEDLEGFLRTCENYPNVSVQGLMTMGPVLPNEKDYRPYFTEVRTLFETYFEKQENAVLSMGMSHSYHIALDCGATLVRVGAKIFGERKNQNGII